MTKPDWTDDRAITRMAAVVLGIARCWAWSKSSHSLCRGRYATRLPSTN